MPRKELSNSPKESEQQLFARPCPPALSFACSFASRLPFCVGRVLRRRYGSGTQQMYGTSTNPLHMQSFDRTASAASGWPRSRLLLRQCVCELFSSINNPRSSLLLKPSFSTLVSFNKSIAATLTESHRPKLSAHQATHASS